MAFEIKPDESVETCVRRLARSQVDKVLAGLTGRGRVDEEETVHDARKRFKRVRALIRLAAEGLGRKLADREASRFRDAGRPLSEVRDAGVLVQALDGLVERYGDQGRPQVFAAARETLLGRKREVRRRVLDEDNGLAHVAGMMKKARRDVKRWDAAGEEWEALEGGLRRIYKRGFLAFREAAKAPTDEALHEWRKRVKDLWYAMDILKPIRPGYVGARGAQAHKLADHLGDDHDLAVLRQTLATPEGGLCTCSSAEVIVPLIDRRRAELKRRAFALGPVVYGERPRAFAARFRAYWRAWRAEVEAKQFDAP